MEKETARIEAFSDGVFAIAITLLILEIKVPLPGNSPLSAQLLRLWPSFLAYIISFAFIGIMWINHHRLFTHIKRADNTLLFTNLLLMFGVTSVPYPTALLAQHLGNPGERTAVVVYQGTYVALAFFFNILWRSARAHHLLGKEVDLAAAQKISSQYSVGPLFYLICLGLVWVSVPLSLLANVGLAVFFAIPPEYSSRIVKKRTGVEA
jgi:uncharacterized membrane protein